MGAHTSNNTVTLPVLRASEMRYFCCFNVKVLSSCSSTWYTHLWTSEQCRIVRDLHGLGNPTGHGYGLPRARVRVGNFPPAKNPYPRGGLPGLTRVFFRVQCTLSSVPPVPPLHSLSSAAADNYSQVTIAASPANSLLPAPSR